MTGLVVIAMNSLTGKKENTHAHTHVHTHVHTHTRAYTHTQGVFPPSQHVGRCREMMPFLLQRDWSWPLTVPTFSSVLKLPFGPPFKFQKKKKKEFLALGVGRLCLFCDGSVRAGDWAVRALSQPAGAGHADHSEEVKFLLLPLSQLGTGQQGEHFWIPTHMEVAWTDSSRKKWERELLPDLENSLWVLPVIHVRSARLKKIVLGLFLNVSLWPVLWC